MTKAIGEKLFLCPIDTAKMQRVLDIGTGTGICQTFRSNLICQDLFTDQILCREHVHG